MHTLTSSAPPAPAAPPAQAAPPAAPPAPAAAPATTSMAALTLLAASSLTVMAGALVAPALPSIARAFAHDPGVELGARLLLTLPALGVALAGPVAGFVADRFGRLPLLLGALVAYALAGSTGLYLDDLRALQVGRFALGVSVAGVMTAATTFIADRWQGAARTRFLGLQAAAMGAGGLFFLVGGGALADLHWRAPFGIYLVALLLLVPAALSLGRRQVASAAMPFVPPGVTTVGPVGAAGAAPAGGVAPAPAGQANGADAPPAPVFALYLAGLAAFALYYLIPTQLPFSLGSRLQATAFEVGLVVGLGTVFSVVASLACGALVRRLGAPRVQGLSFIGLGLGFALLAPDAGWAPVLVGMVGIGLGGGLIVPNLAAWLTAAAAPERRGRVVGGLTTAVFAGQFLSPLLAQPLRAEHGLHGALGVFAAAAALALVVGVALWLRFSGRYSASRVS